MQPQAVVLGNEEGLVWNELVSSHPLGRAVVTTHAGGRWAADGWSLWRLGVFDGSALTAGLAVCTKRVPHLPHSLARVAAILPDSRSVTDSTVDLLRCMDDFARQRNILETEIRCSVPDGVEIAGLDYSAGIAEALQRSGYRRTEVRQGTYLIRIDAGDDELLGSFSKDCRHDIRLGLRKGAEAVCLDLPEDLELLIETERAMRARKGLLRRLTPQYSGLEPLLEAGLAVLFGVSYRDKVRNMCLVDGLGIPQGILAAVTPWALQKGTPPTGQMLHFEIMRYFRDRGATYYDFAGAPGPVPRQGHPNFTVWRFKHGFNGRYVTYLPYYRKSGLAGRLITSVARRLGRL